MVASQRAAICGLILHVLHASQQRRQTTRLTLLVISRAAMDRRPEPARGQPRSHTLELQAPPSETPPKWPNLLSPRAQELVVHESASWQAYHPPRLKKVDLSQQNASNASPPSANFPLHAAFLMGPGLSKLQVALVTPSHLRHR